MGDVSGPPAEQAVDSFVLELLGSYSRLQDACDWLLANHLESVTPLLAVALRGRIERVSDKERARIAIAIAGDLGRAAMFKNFSDVAGRVKAFRDLVGHGHFVATSPLDDKALLIIDAGFQPHRFTWAQLVKLAADCEWLSECVYFLSDEAHYNVKPLTRHDGTLLSDSPPPISPPMVRTTNRVALIEKLPDNWEPGDEI